MITTKQQSLLDNLKAVSETLDIVKIDCKKLGTTKWNSKTQMTFHTRSYLKKKRTEILDEIANSII